MSAICREWINKHLIALLLALAMLRVGFLLLSDFDLLGDESYYWDWSRQPDWCYFSKPPMVAWLIGISTGWLGDVTWAVRLPTVLLGTVFLWFFHATAKAFYGAVAAATALLLVLATPANTIANFLMTIDPPLYCFWMMALYFLHSALFGQRRMAWFWAGCASAAGLLSKQVAIALPIMLLIFLASDAERRRFLMREFWLYLLPIAVAAVPILLWNQQHDWVMFGHSKAHFGSPEAVSWLKHLQHARDFLLYQLLLLSPLIFVLTLVDSVRSAIGFRQLSAEQRFLWLMGPVLLLGILLLSVMQKVQGNWPMPFYFSALIVLAGRWSEEGWKKPLKWALSLGYLLVVMTYLLPLLMQFSGLQNSAFDPTKRFKNWQALAESIHEQRLRVQPNLDGSFVVAMGHRFVASQLAFYLPNHPKVFRFETSGQVTSQYEVWSGPRAFIGKNAFVVSQGREDKLPAELKAAFERFRLVAEIADPNNPNSRYYLYLGERLESWPLPRQ